MIVLGVDPGARATGLVVVDTDVVPGIPPALLGSTTVERPKDGRNLLDVPPEYLRSVIAAMVEAMRQIRDEATLEPTRHVELIAVERVRRPSWHVARGSKSGKGGAAADPTALLATAVVLGAILGRAWTVPVVTVPPDRNGRQLPLDAYPTPLATTGKGQDKRRHERSAYDVACAGPQLHRYATATGGGIYP